MEYIVRKEVRLRAGRAQVWRALTDPEITKKYFFGCRVLSDWKEGSSIEFRGRMFWVIPIRMKGTITRIEPLHLLRYTLDNQGSDSRSAVIFTLSEDGSQTVLTVSDDVGQGDGAEKRYNRSLTGWDRIFKGLKETVEKRP